MVKATATATVSAQQSVAPSMGSHDTAVRLLLTLTVRLKIILNVTQPRPITFKNLFTARSCAKRFQMRTSA